MSEKKQSKYTADEQQALITLAWVAGAAVSECDKSGGDRETAKEATTLSSAVAAGFIAFQQKTKENLSGGEPKAFDFEKAESLLPKACEDALAVIEKKEAAPIVELYKKIVLEIAFSVAMAYGEGKRDKGPRVSDKELTMIKKIAEALKASSLVADVQKDAEAHAPQQKLGR